jgi:acetylornithine deacetylase
LARVTILGREAHSSLPGQGISSIYAAARFISSIEQFAETLTLEENTFFCPPFTTVNIGTVHGGSAKNIIPGRTELLVEWRPIPGQSPDLVPAKLGSMLAALEKQYPGLRTVLDVLRQDAGFKTNAESSLVRSLENATGRSAVSIPFGSEAGVWSDVANEVVVFGPGEMNSAHSNRERVSLAELELCIQTVTRLMQSD